MALKNKAESLLEILRQQENEIRANANVAKLTKMVKETKIGDDEFFINRFASAAVLMAFGLNHEKIKFAKWKFYERIDSFCRQSVKVALIVRRRRDE